MVQMSYNGCMTTFRFRSLVYVLFAVGFCLLFYIAFTDQRITTSKCCNCLLSEDWTETQRALANITKVRFLTGHAENGRDPGFLNAVGSHEVTTLDSSLEGPLPIAFQKALEMYPVVPTNNVRIVLIASYYRSGSSFFGELLSSGPMTYFHFEPLQPFTVPGRIRPGRQSLAFAVLDELVRCRMYNVPLLTLWQENGREYKHNRFLVDVCDKGPPCSSPGHISALCSRAKTQVFKFTRLSIPQMVAWVNRNSDIAENIRVVYLVRDPRATYASRRNMSWCSKDEECGDAKALCTQMRQDLNEYERLKLERWWLTRIHMVRFEDVATDPIYQARNLFSRLGLDYGPSVVSFVKNHTVASQEDLKNPYSTRRNARHAISSWTKKLSKESIDAVNTVCSDILHRLGYNRFGGDVHKGKKE